MARMTRASGFPDYSSAGTDGKFIPQLWSGKLVEKFYAATVFGAISNTDYEGEIADYGDSVQIRTTPSLTINDYSIGQTLTYETPTSSEVLLEINKGKYFAFEVDDVDAYQADIDLMNDWAEDGSEQMKIAIDTDVLSGIYGDVNANNKGLTAGAISGNIDLGTLADPLMVDKDGNTSGADKSVIDLLVDLGTVMDEQNIPESGRWVVLPAWAINRIKKSDLKDASLAGDATSILRNGRVGMIDRFTVYLSNNVHKENTTASPIISAWHAVAGHSSGLAFAAQMTKMENLPNPNKFGQLIRGLNVYGYKVIEGNYLCEAVIAPA